MSTQVVGNVLLWATAVPAVGSVLVFSRVTWWRSKWGRHLMAYMAAVALMLVLGCIRQVFGDSPAFYAIRTGAFGTVFVSLWWRFVILVQASREGSPDDSDLDSSRPPP